MMMENAVMEIKWWRKMEWWPCWIGIVGFFFINVAVHTGASTPGFTKWDARTSVRVSEPGLLALMIFYVFASCWLAVFASQTKDWKTFPFGFLVTLVFSFLSKLLAAEDAIHAAKIGDSIWAIVFGMFLVNVIFPKETPTWLKIAQQTELYIASSLVLLLIDLQQLGTLGSRAFLVAWVDTPVLCVLMVYFGWRILKVHITDAIILCSTTLICGSSAAIAMTNALHLPKEKSELSIAISSLMTIPVIGFLPPLAMALGMNSYEAGAWFGGCVDSTGAVIATASVLDDNEVLSSSAIVKMIQNILIAPFSLVVVLLVVYFPNIVEGYIPLVPSKTANLDEKSSSFYCWFAPKHQHESKGGP